LINRIAILTSLLLLPFTLCSQNRRKINDYYYIHKNIGVEYYTGCLMPHHRVLDTLRQGQVKAFELNLSLRTRGYKHWHRFYHFPRVGLSYMYADFKNKRVLGTALCIAPFIQFNFIEGDWLSLQLKVSAGLSLIDKNYDSLKNRQNMAIASSINMVAKCGLNSSIRLSNRVFITLGANMLHFTNGSYKEPDYGLYFLLWNAGLNVSIDAYQKVHRYVNFPRKITPTWYLTLSGSAKEEGPPGGARYVPISLSGSYSKPYKKLLHYGGVFDVMYDQSSFVHFRQDSLPYRAKTDALKVGVALEGELSLDRLSGFGNLGVYLYNRDRKVGPIYHRLGVRYRVARRIKLQLALKSHYLDPDYLEVGLLVNMKYNPYGQF